MPCLGDPHQGWRVGHLQAPGTQGCVVHIPSTLPSFLVSSTRLAAIQAQLLTPPGPGRAHLLLRGAAPPEGSCPPALTDKWGNRSSRHAEGLGGVPWPSARAPHMRIPSRKSGCSRQAGSGVSPAPSALPSRAFEPSPPPSFPVPSPGTPVWPSLPIQGITPGGHQATSFSQQ